MMKVDGHEYLAVTYTLIMTNSSAADWSPRILPVTSPNGETGPCPPGFMSLSSSMAEREI